MGIRLGSVPSSTLDDTDSIIFCEGEAPRKASYGKMKADIIGTGAQTTGDQSLKGGINEINQGLLDIGGYGIISGGVVIAQSTPNMTVQVSECIYKTAAGARKTAAAIPSLAVTTADTANPRKDIVYINSSGVISYLQGIAVANPTAPTVPTEGLLLAEISVSANTTSIASANITDKRKMIISTDWLNLQLLKNVRRINELASLRAKLLNGEITKIKIIGDSNTEGYGVIEHTAITPNANNGNPIIFTDGTTTYYEADYTSRCFANYFRQYLSANFPSAQFVNAAIGGKTAKWANENKQYLIGNSEDVLIINLGTNDKYPETLAEYTTYMTQLLAYAKARCNILIVCTPVYAANDYVNGVISPANKFTTDDMEKTISQICATNGYIHVSLLNGMKKFSELYNYDLNQMVNADLVHLNLVGHYIAWNVFQKEFGFESDIGKNVFQNNFSQMLIDGNFQVSQLIPAINTNVVNPSFYTYPLCDMWKLEGYNSVALPNITHTKKLMDSNLVPLCKYFYRISVDGAIQDGQYLLSQIIKNGISKHMNGKEIINVSFWARSNIAKKLAASFYLKFGTGGNPSGDIYTPGLSASLSSEWTKYSFSLTLDLRNKVLGTNDDDYMTFRITIRDDNNPFASAGYVDIANVLVSTTGSTPKAYSKAFGEELQSCMQYLEKSNEYNIPMSTVTPYTYENSNIIKLKVEKAFRPTISLYSWQTGAKNNIAYVNGPVWSDSTSFTLSNPSTKMFDFNTALTNYRYNYVADARP